MMPRPKGVHIRVEEAPSQESVSAPVVVFVVIVVFVELTSSGLIIAV